MVETANMSGRIKIVGIYNSAGVVTRVPISTEGTINYVYENWDNTANNYEAYPFTITSLNLPDPSQLRFANSS